MNDFDDRAAAAGDRLRRRATELAAVTPFDGSGGGRRPAGPDAPWDRRWIAVAAAAAVVVVGVAGLIVVSDDAPDVITDVGSGPPELDTVPDTLPISSTPDPAPTTDPPTTADPVTTVPVTTVPATTVPATTSVPTTVAPQPLLRPIIDPTICEPIAARDGPRLGGEPIVLFARRSEFPISIQVIGDPATGPAGPFALVQRFRDRPFEQAVATNDEAGRAAGVRTFDNGNGEFIWNLEDGGQGYLRARGLSVDAITSIAEALEPRQLDAAIAGFDYSPAGDGAYELLEEQMNTDVVGQSSASQCRLPSGSIYSVAVVAGDAVYRYGSVIDRLPPLSVGVRDDAVLLVSGQDIPSAPTVSDVVEADEATWLELRTRTPDGQPRIERIGDEIEVLAELKPAGGGTADGYLTFMLVEAEGVPFLQVYTGNATIPDRGVYWHVQIDGRTRLITTARAGGTLGQRIGDEFPPAPFIVEVSIIDNDDLVLQTTGEIMLAP